MLCMLVSLFCLRHKETHLNKFQYPTYVHPRESGIRCNDHGKNTKDVAWARKESGFVEFSTAFLNTGNGDGKLYVSICSCQNRWHQR